MSEPMPVVEVEGLQQPIIGDFSQFRARVAELERLAASYPYTRPLAKACAEQPEAERLSFAFHALAYEACHRVASQPIATLARELQIACRFEVSS